MAFLLKEQSSGDPILQLACELGFNILDVMHLGVSPIALLIVERELPLYRRCAEIESYSAYWQLGENEASDDAMKEEWNAGKTRSGTLTLTKVE